MFHLSQSFFFQNICRLQKIEHFSSKLRLPIIILPRYLMQNLEQYMSWQNNYHSDRSFIAFVIRLDKGLQLSHLVVKIINIMIFGDDLVQSLHAVSKLLLLDHQEIFGIFIQVILSGSSQDDHSLGVTVHFCWVFHGLVVAVVAGASTLDVEKVEQMKTLQDSLGHLQVEGRVEEELDLRIVSESLEQIFHDFDGGVESVVNSHAEHLFDFLDGIQQSLGLDFQFRKSLFFAIGELYEQAIDFPGDDNLLGCGLGRGSILDGVESPLTEGLSID